MFILLIETWLKKYKFVNDVKISKFNVANASIALKNKKIEKNAITKNRKFEQIEQTTIIQNKIKTFFNNVNNNITNKFFFSHLSIYYWYLNQFQFLFYTFNFQHQYSRKYISYLSTIVSRSIFWYFCSICINRNY